MNKTRSRLASVLPAVVFGALFLGFWEWAVRFFELKPYFLTAPSAIWQQFTGNFSLVRDAATVSGTNALVGLVAGTVLGIAMSFVLSRFGFLNQLITPLAVALNAVPIFVLVAVLNNMYSITSEIPRRIMVALVVYFIVLVNVARGLTQVSRPTWNSCGRTPRATRQSCARCAFPTHCRFSSCR